MNLLPVKIIIDNISLCNILPSILVNKSVWKYYQKYIKDSIEDVLRCEIQARYLLKNPEELLNHLKENGKLSEQFLKDNHDAVNCSECINEMDCYHEDDFDTMYDYFFVEDQNQWVKRFNLDTQWVKSLNLDTTYLDEFINLSMLMSKICNLIEYHDVHLDDHILKKINKYSFVVCLYCIE